MKKHSSLPQRMEVHLVDGTYELFRHYYAVPSARDADGREVGAVRGVLASILAMLNGGSTHLGVATALLATQVLVALRADPATVPGRVSATWFKSMVSLGKPRITGMVVITFLGGLWLAPGDIAHWRTIMTLIGTALLVALAIAVAAIYGQVTVNDMIMARYTADAWRGRVYAVRYFLLFISAGAAIGMISLLHETGGFALVLGVNAVIALLLFVTTLALVAMIISVEGRQRTQPAE